MSLLPDGSIVVAATGAVDRAALVSLTLLFRAPARNILYVENGQQLSAWSKKALAQDSGRMVLFIPF